MSLEILKKVDAILDTAEVPERHTYFQLKNFIVGKECTVQGQLWQVIRELRARRDSLESLQDQLADLRDNMELIDLRIEKIKHDNRVDLHPSSGHSVVSEELKAVESQEREVMIRKAHREKRSLARNRLRLEKQMKYLSEEITYLAGAYEVLVKVEPLKPIDDIESQRKYWDEKFMEELNLRLLLKQPLDPDFVRTVMALDDNSSVKVQMTAILQNVQNHMLADRDRQRAAQAQITAIKERGVGER